MKKPMTPDNRNPVRLLQSPRTLSCIAGLLLVLAWPPFDLPVLQIAAFVLLFQLIREAPDDRTALIRALPAFWIWNLGTTYWLMMATFWGGITAILANGLLMLLPLWAIRRLLELKIPPLIQALLAGSLWASYEFLHHQWDLAWPWLTLGNGWANLPLLTQHISWTGYSILSVWVVASALLFEQSLRTRTRRDLAVALLLFTSSPLLSAVASWQWEPDEGPPMEVAVVQPNHDSYLPNGGYVSTDQVVQKLLELTSQTRTRQTELIVWPENAIDRSLPARNAYNRVLTDSLREWESRLITGSGYLEYYDEETPAPMIHRNTSQGTPYNVFNSALYYTPGHTTPDIYKKGRLVPIVERLPFAKTLRKFDVGEWIPWGEISGYGKGTDATLFPVGHATTPALICYDSVFPGWVNQFTGSGPGFLTIITNDGWWGNTSGHTQHFAYARLRAIEQRQWVVRSANNGISGIIAPDGSVHRKTGYWERTGFVHDIHASNKPSLYSRMGDRFNHLLLLVSGLALLLPLRKRLRKQ
ncbi:MAG: apolipoprotein N-acyltransferase [Balneolaceae bacterium]